MRNCDCCAEHATESHMDMSMQTDKGFVGACYTACEKIDEFVAYHVLFMPAGMKVSPDLAAIRAEDMFTKEELCWIAGAFLTLAFEKGVSLPHAIESKEESHEKA